MPDQSGLPESVLKRFDAIRRREETELRILCDHPDNFAICQCLTDRVYGAVAAYLCHFDHLTTGRQTDIDPCDAIQEIQDLIRDEFKKLTGREYLPEAARQVVRARDERRLVDKIMRPGKDKP